MSSSFHTFSDRKLNRCAHCGTNEQIIPTFRADGRLYFLCRDGLTLATASEDDEREKYMKLLGVTIVRRDEPG